MIAYCKRNPMLVIGIATLIASLLGFIVGSAYNQGTKDQKVEQISTDQNVLRADMAKKVESIDQKIDGLGVIAATNSTNIAALQKGQNDQRKDITDIRDAVYKYLVPKQIAEGSYGVSKQAQ